MDHRRYRLPMLRPVHTAHGRWTAREGLLVRLEAGDGRVGFGEAAPAPWHGGESLEEVAAALAELGERVTADVLERVDRRLGSLRFALAAARELERALPRVTERLPVAALLPAGRAALAAADRARAAGYGVCKWKVAVEPAAEELAMLDDVLARLASGATLRLDANGGWTAKEAERWLDRCAERPIEFVEQPCLADPGDGEVGRRRVDDLLRGLARDYPTPVALDESVTGLPSLQGWLERGWPGVLVVKPALAGAPREVLALLKTHRADAVFSSAIETVVGRRTALQMALAYAGPRPRAPGFGVGVLFGDPRLDGPAVGPELSAADLDRMNPEAAWNALS